MVVSFSKVKCPYTLTRRGMPHPKRTDASNSQLTGLNTHELGPFENGKMAMRNSDISQALIYLSKTSAATLRHIYVAKKYNMMLTG